MDVQAAIESSFPPSTRQWPCGFSEPKSPRVRQSLNVS